ncbi:hypothetical protein TWF569_003396 [Orbilia oligospora]|nr:hypothetical protein TWF569_003396 [Orbilia oligospora]
MPILILDGDTNRLLLPVVFHGSSNNMTASELDLGKDNHRRVRDWFIQYAYDTRPTEMGTMTQIIAAIAGTDFVPDNHTISNQYNINYRAM